MWKLTFVKMLYMTLSCELNAFHVEIVRLWQYLA
jgi:hypothetical protein